ncbi:hypothetical protein D9M71_795920 [compost metagenome]
MIMSTHPGSIWLEQNWSRSVLPEGHWVAAGATGLIEHSPVLSALYLAIVNSNISFDDVTIAYVWFGEIQ